MSCSRKRSVIDKMTETSIERAFLYSGADVVAGCGFFLNDWIQFTTVTESRETVGCQQPQYLSDGSWNNEWSSDPCCNHDKRIETCCSPRVTFSQREAIDKIDYEAVGLYQGVVNYVKCGSTLEANPLANDYAKLENVAARDCYPVFYQAYNATRSVAGVIKDCKSAIDGVWNNDKDRYLGGTCQSNLDCHTQMCEVIPTRKRDASASSGGASSGAQATKNCVLPRDTAAQDFLTPFVRCVVAHPTTLNM
jgi:hypothetical protein